MQTSKKLKKLKIYNKSCYGLKEVDKNSIDSLITDPPYGISYQNHYWDNDLPDPKIWADSIRVLKPGGFGMVFSSIRLMHRLMVSLEDAGFIIKDVVFWNYLNGMPKSRDISLDIDKELGVDSKIMGKYKYVQGYKKGGSVTYKNKGDKFKYGATSELALKYKGGGLGIKPFYEPIILIQKPIDKKNTVAQNIIKYGTGALNLEQTRIPYEKGEGKVGHNPHPKGRVSGNIIRIENFNDDYDKFFSVSKVRQSKDNFNTHPTLKPVELMEHLIKLTTFGQQIILDPFMGSGSTGLASLNLNRNFIGYEIDKEYFKIAKKRLKNNL